MGRKRKREKVPEAVYQEMLGYRTKSPFAFAAYNDQLRHFRAHKANLITGLAVEFRPEGLGRLVLQSGRGMVKGVGQGASLRPRLPQDHAATRPAGGRTSIARSLPMLA